MKTLESTCDELESTLDAPPAPLPNDFWRDEEAWRADWEGRIRALVALGDVYLWQAQKYRDHDDKLQAIEARYRALRWKAFEACGGKTFSAEV